MKASRVYALLFLLTSGPSHGGGDSIEALKERIADLEEEIGDLKKKGEITLGKIEEEPRRPAEYTEMVVALRENGSMTLNGKEIVSKDLLKMLTQAVASYSDQAVVIRGEDAVPYRRVLKVLESCNRAGAWNIGFAAIRPEPEQEHATDASPAP